MKKEVKRLDSQQTQKVNLLDKIKNNITKLNKSNKNAVYEYLDSLKKSKKEATADNEFLKYM